MINVPTIEHYDLFSPHHGILTVVTEAVGFESVQPFTPLPTINNTLLVQLFHVDAFCELVRTKQNILTVGIVCKDFDEGLPHTPTHIQLSVLRLEEPNDIVN